MSYQDYSTQFVLDQFLTYINVNQLGSNDKHLADSFDVEHNWNIATVDGTHDWVAIAEVHIDDHAAVGAQSYWTPSAGLYQLAGKSVGIFNIEFWVYIEGAWHGPGGEDAGSYGLFLCDGSNMRFYNGSGMSSPVSVFYQKF